MSSRGKFMKRCFYFEEDGSPRGEGCSRSARTCKYVHPEDLEWKDAAHSYPSRKYHSDLPSMSPPHSDRTWDRKDSPKRTRTYSRSPPRHDSRKHPRYSRSPPRSLESRDGSRGESSNDAYERGRGRRPSAIKDWEERSKERGEAPPMSSSLAAALQSPQSIPPLSEPPPPTSIPPAPPMPSLPSFLTDKESIKPSQAEASTEEKRAIWTERIKLMSASLQARADYMKLETEGHNLKNLVQSSRYSGLNEERKAQLNTRLVDVEAQCRTQKNVMNTAISRLVESDPWPATHLRDNDLGVKGGNIIKFVEELTRTATDMKDILEQIRTRKTQSKSPNDMDIDLANAERPLKRRRFSNDGSETGFAHQQIDKDQLSDRLDKIEGRLLDLKNNLSAHDADFETELEARIVAKWEELRDTALPPELDPEQAAKLREVEHDINITGDQVGELAEEVGGLIVRYTAFDAEIQRLRNENTTYKHEIALMEAKFAEYEEWQQKHQKKTQALEAALSAYIARPSSPLPPAPSIPPEYVLHSIRPQVVDSVRLQIQPLINGLRTNIQDMLLNQNKELYDTLGGKLTATLRMMDLISASITQGSPVNHAISSVIN